MGHSDRRGSYSLFLKMDITTWLSFILGVISLATPALSSEPRVVCYYTNWSVYRPGTARFNPQNINPYLCTHLIYAFGGFTKDNTLKPFDKYQDIEKGGYAKFTGLKTYNKNLKTMLAIGGWNEGSTRFSPMVASREKRKEFVRNAIKFLRQNRFDGLDLDWEYPAFRDGGKPKDRENYARLVKELREEFEREAEKTGKPRLLLTMAVPAGIEYIQKGFDVKTLNQYLDWMNLLTYDYHSAFEPAVNHHAPLYPLEEPNEYSVDTELNIDYTIKFYLENGADPDKLVLGIPTYGRSYTLFNADAVEIGSPADGPGEQGDATREKGYLAYYEICEALKPKANKKRSISDEDSEEYEEEDDEEEKDWTVMHPNPAAMGPVAFRGNQWVGYDDVDIVRRKGEYVAENRLGGIMFWSIDNDDFRGNCHEKPYPLIEAAKEAYIAKLGTTDNSVAFKTPKPVSKSSGGRRRNRPKTSPSTTTTTTTPKPASKSNKRKSSVSSTTPSWNITPEPPTTPDPGSDFKCVDEGFFPHPRDCKKYFWCLDSGPSNLGIVAHQFTCPSGLFFNKAADSCDFARNVLCKIPASTTKAPTTKAATTKPATTITTTTTTKKPIRLSTKSSVLFRTSSTTPEPESEEYEDDVSEDVIDDDAEDPRVIKELIDLIKKVGGVEQLEKQLHLAESGSSSAGSTAATSPAPFNTKLYQKVLERAREKTRFSGANSILQSANSRRGPQNQGLEPSADKDRLLKKDRPQYTTINRQRAIPSPESDSEEEEETEAPVLQTRVRAVETQARGPQAREPQAREPQARDTQTRGGTTAKPLQYVNIRRAKPTIVSDTADDTASRNALFERSEPIVSVSEQNSLDIQSSRKENVPEYVTIRRQRPTTEETTTVQYEAQETEQETALERELSSQPQYTSIIRTRGTTVSVTEEPNSSEPPFIRPRSTTLAPLEELSTPEPTTVLAVQISSLLNSASSDQAVETTVVQTEPEPTTSTTSRPTTTSTTTTSTVAPPSSTRRTILRRRGSTSTTTTTTTPGPSSSTTQVSARNYTFVRRRRPLQNPNEILDSDNDLEVSRKIRSTTPDSREVEGGTLERETGQGRRFRSRFQSTQNEDSVAAAAVSRGQFRPKLSPDEIVSLTPVEVEPQFVPRQGFRPRVERQFRGRTTPADAIVDSESSAATVETSRPLLLPRGRNRFTVSSGTEAVPASPTTESTFSQRRPTFARFSPRPFGRSTAPTFTPLKVEDNNQAATEITQRAPLRASFGRPRPGFTTNAPGIQARRLPFPSRALTTPQSLVSEADDDDEPESKADDISLSESAIEEKEHLEENIEDIEQAPKRRVIVKKLRAPTEEIPTEAIPIDDSGKRRFKIIRRKPATSPAPATEGAIASEDLVSQTPRIRKVIRKKINRVIEEEPEVIAKSIGSLETFKVTSTLAPTTEGIINYGEKRRASTTSAPSTLSPITTTKQITGNVVDEVSEKVKETLQDFKIKEDNIKNFNNGDTELIKTEEVEVKQEEVLIKDTENKEIQIDTMNNDKGEILINTNTETDSNPEVAIESEQKAIDLSETKVTTTEEPITTVTADTAPETTTITTTVSPSPTPRARLPFRSQKRLFTSTTESIPSSSRIFSRKYNPGVYTSPASVPTRAPVSIRPSIPRRPAIFTRRPFTTVTARTTTRLQEEEEEYSDEEILDDEPENPFVFVPSSQLFTRKPETSQEDAENEDESEEIFEDGNENDQEEEEEKEEPQQRVTSTTKRPFRPRLINSNTFRAATSTTELPKRFGTSQNRSTVYTRFASNKPVNDTKKRVANVPVGYNISDSTSVPTLKNETQDEIIKEHTTTSASITKTETTTDNDYLEITESISTLSDSTNTDTLSTNTDKSETVTAQMEISTDDYLEFPEQTTYYPSTQDDIPSTTNARIVYYQNTASNTETTTETLPQTTTNTPIPPLIKTQFDKLFSVSRVVEVSSKLDKHRVNKYNETTLIEEGQVMVEKKPVVDKIGEVSRFSLIKIVEDEIPIYLTKLGHVYPVENPPDNLIRIDETRNARALNYVEPPRENLVASESINEAYRHIKTLSDLNKDAPKSEVEHVTSDDFLSNTNVKKSDKTQEEPLFTQWQFVPAAYENEQNKAAKTFEIVTPRALLTNPSTLSLEGLFKTEMPLTARKVGDDHNQPFLVYSASVPSQKEEANIVKLEVLKPEGRSILTFAKGQEFNGGSAREEISEKSAISVSIVPNTEIIPTSTTSTVTSTTENSKTSPIVEMLTSEKAVTESSTITITEDFTTDTTPEETTTVKLSPVELIRAKYGGFPRRPIIKPGNLTRANVPRTIKIANTTVSANLFQKTNKTAPFSPNKSRFSTNRSQNVPVDIRKKSTSKTPKVFTTESPRTTTERKPFFKAPRPTFRPAFIPRRTTPPSTTEDS